MIRKFRAFTRQVSFFPTANNIYNVIFWWKKKKKRKKKVLLKRRNKLNPKFMVLFAFIFLPARPYCAASFGYLNANSTCIAVHRRIFTCRDKKWQVMVKQWKQNFRPYLSSPFFLSKHTLLSFRLSVMFPLPPPPASCSFVFFLIFNFFFFYFLPSPLIMALPARCTTAGWWL